MGNLKLVSFFNAVCVCTGLILGSMLLVACAAEQAAPPPAPPASTFNKAIGAYSASGAQTTGVLSKQYVNGSLIRAGWSTIEPAPGEYNYKVLEASISRVKAEGKKWSLAVLAGPATPEWIYAAPYNAPRINYLLRKEPQVMAPAWDPAVRERLRLLALDLALKFGTDPDLEIVYVTQMTSNGIEGQLPQDSQLLPQASELLPGGTTWASYGWTADLWVATVTGTVKDFANAFTEKALAVELHDVLDDAEIPQRIGDDVCSDTQLSGRVGIAIWWLSGRTTYQPELLEYFRTSTCDKYGQVIAPSNDPSQFPAVEGYAAVFVQAKELRLRYLEFWEEEFSTFLEWQDEIADFNTWTAKTFPE